MDTLIYFIYRIFINAIGIGFAAILFQHINVDSFDALIIAAIMLTALNLLLKPLLVMLSLPFLILSFGIAYFFVNALILLLASSLTDGFFIDGVWTAVGGSLIVGLINMLFDAFSPNRKHRTFVMKVHRRHDHDDWDENR